MHHAAVRQGDQAAQAQAAAVGGELRQPGDRRLAGPVERRQQGPLGADAQGGLGAGDGIEKSARAGIVDTNLQPDGTLTDRRQHDLRRQRGGDPVGLAEAAQTGDRQERRIDLALGQLSQACRHVAAEVHHLEVRAGGQDLRLSAQRGAADNRALRQVREIGAVRREEGVARILARQEVLDRKSLRQPGRHVLHGMHRGVDFAGQERLFDFLGEKTLAADLRKSAVLNEVAGGLDDDDGHGVLGGEFGMGFAEAAAHLAGLGQGERRAPGTEAQKRFRVHGAKI